MSYKPFAIANYDENGGLNQFYESFLIPEKAFVQLEDAYAWRGRILKRPGIANVGRLRRVLSATSAGNLAASHGSYPYTFTWDPFGASYLALRATEPNSQIQPGTVASPIVITIGAQTITDTLGTGATTVSGTGVITASTIYYSSGTLSITISGALTSSPAAVTFGYYPGLPVMGLPDEETNTLNNQLLLAFDTKYAYYIHNGQFLQLGSAAWSGSDDNFFWTSNYWSNAAGNGQLIWTVNGNVSDGIKYWDQSTWTTFAPIVAADSATTPTSLLQAKIMLPYKGRMIAMNTWEGYGASYKNYQQRIRFSQAGTPITVGSVQAGPEWNVIGSWGSDSGAVGYGGYIDLPTSEQIISAEFIKDVLLVKCEKSSWKINYTGNRVLPFYPEKINTILGASSTFSMVPFDSGVYTIGDYGVTLDNSVSVEKADISVPNYVMNNFSNANLGLTRVQGLRDFAQELIYWTFPSSARGGTGSPSDTYPDKMLVYNYRNNTYAIFNDSFTALGYYQNVTGPTWATLPWSTWSGWPGTWASGSTQALYPSVVGGNQQGFVSVFNQGQPNGYSLAITAINGSVSPATFTVPSHNLQDGQYIQLSGLLAGGATPDFTTLNNKIYQVAVSDADKITLRYSSSGGLLPVTFSSAGTYIGGGLVAVLNGMNIQTKTFCPTYTEGAQVRLGYVDLLLESNPNGQVNIDLYVDESQNTSISQTSQNPSLLGTNVITTGPENATLIPYQKQQSKIWHRFFSQAVCQNFSLKLSLTEAEMFSPNIIASDFTLHSTVFYLSKNARLVQ